MTNAEAIQEMLKEIQAAYERGLAEGQKLAQQQYAKGYEDGLAMGRTLEIQEWKTSARKHYERGYQAALVEMQEQSKQPEQQTSTTLSA